MGPAAHYGTIVIGIGGMGSAVTAHLAERGVDVLGLERYDIPHAMGSSHGKTRIIRRAQYEDPAYVPLVERAYELWRAREAEHHCQLLYTTGEIDAGPPDSEIVAGSLRSCREHDLDHERLSGATVNERFPGYQLPEDYEAVYQPDGGFLVPEQCIVAHVNAAHAAGAEIHAREAVTGWEPRGDGVRVTTETGQYTADNLVVTAGAWTGKLLPTVAPFLEPERQVLAWLQPTEPAAFAPDRFPVFILETTDSHYYGFPVFDVPGFKVGRFNHLEESVDPDTMDRTPTDRDEQVLREFAETYFPTGAGPTMQLAPCLFTNTPDGHFILDHHPEHPRVTIGAGFSGHGFKFASAIGEIIADLSETGRTDHDIERFRLDRFDGLDQAR
ncbi:MAG: N-methyl-L-tryptophan oxidase [Halobacteriales archaeon]